MIITTDTLNDSSYDNLVKIGGVAQAYVTLKWPDLLAAPVASPGRSARSRIATASPAPKQESTGYYGTYLFGRTHVAGEAVTANFDLNEHWQLVSSRASARSSSRSPTSLTTTARRRRSRPIFRSRVPCLRARRFFTTRTLRCSPTTGYRSRVTTSTRSRPTTSPRPAKAIGGRTEPARAHDSLWWRGPRRHGQANGYIGYSHIDAVGLLPLAGAHRGSPRRRWRWLQGELLRADRIRW